MPSLDPILVERYLARAAAAGLAKDQVDRFVKFGYVALPWLLPFHVAAREADKAGGPTMIGVGGARGPGKSFGLMGQAGLDDCQRCAGLKFLFLRKVMKSAGESFDDLIRRVFGRVAREVTAGRVVFRNGSRILIGGYKDENDIDKYLGIEYDGIVIEEGTQLSGEKREKIRGSLRTSRSDWRPRLYESANPGGVGHKAFKDLYVMPWREKRQSETRFFPGTYKDNPFTQHEYRDYLESLKGPLGQAWRDGDWDVFEGQAFMFNYIMHVVKAFEIPASWTRWRGIDWGRRNPFACVWLAKDPDTGRIIFYRELYEAGLTDRQQARKIKDYTLPGEKIAATFADPSMWTKKSVEDRVYSTADEYAAEGVALSKGDNNRIMGKRKVDTLLANLPDGQPGLLVFENCVNLAKQLANLPYDGVNVEDVDSHADDHAYDAARYAITQIVPRPRVLTPLQALGTDPIAKMVLPREALGGKDF